MPEGFDREAAQRELDDARAEAREAAIVRRELRARAHADVQFPDAWDVPNSGDEPEAGE